MKGTISSTTVLVGSALTMIIFMVSVMLVVSNAIESSINIELTEITRMYGDIMSDMLINSPNWYSIDRLEKGDILAEPYTSHVLLGYNCFFRDFGSGGKPIYVSSVKFGSANSECGQSPSGLTLYAEERPVELLENTVERIENRAKCNVFNEAGKSGRFGYFKCQNSIPFSTNYYLHSDCGCLAWEDPLTGIVHPGIVDWQKAADNEANCADHPLPFCMDASGFYWKATVTDKDGVEKTFGWNSKTFGEDVPIKGDVTIKKVVGIYKAGTGKIEPGRITFTLKAADSRKRITINDE